MTDNEQHDSVQVFVGVDVGKGAHHAVTLGLIGKSLTPSYFIEGMLYNIPDENRGLSFDAKFVNCFSWLVSADQRRFVCANGLPSSVSDYCLMAWPTANYDLFLRHLGDYWTRWL